MLSIRGFENDIFNLASKESLTVYDASYFYTTMKNNLIFVTDDDKLRNKASRYIRILTSAELSLRYGFKNPSSSQ